MTHRKGGEAEAASIGPPTAVIGGVEETGQVTMEHTNSHRGRGKYRGNIIWPTRT